MKVEIDVSNMKNFTNQDVKFIAKRDGLPPMEVRRRLQQFIKDAEAINEKNKN